MRIKFLCVLFVAALTLAFSRADASIVFNVDFESGNTGFQSDYTYYTPTTPVGMIPEDNYSIVAKPTDVHTLWYSFYDHTFGDGTGHMMVASMAQPPKVTGSGSKTSRWKRVLPMC